MKKTIFSISLILIILLFACKKPIVYPNEPQIDYQKIIIKDSINEFNEEVVSYDLIFNALDGDSNLGLRQSDTVDDFSYGSPYYNNAFISLYKKLNGEFIEADVTYTIADSVYTDTLRYNQRIPHTDPVGLNDYFKAEIKVNMQIEKIIFDADFFKFDTIKFVFYVVDKDFNISNIQETHEIIKDFRGTLTDTDTVIIY